MCPKLRARLSPAAMGINSIDNTIYPVLGAKSALSECMIHILLNNCTLVACQPLYIIYTLWLYTLYLKIDWLWWLMTPTLIMLNSDPGPWCTILSRQEGGTKSQDSLHGLAEVWRWWKHDHARIRIKTLATVMVQNITFFFVLLICVYIFAHTCRRSWLELMFAAVVVVIVIIVIVIHHHHETMMVNVVIIKSKVYCKYHSILGGNSAVLSSRATTKAHTPSPQMDASVLHIIDESISTRGPPSPSLNSLTGTFYSNFRRRIQIGLTSNCTKSPGGETPYIQCQ